MNKRTNSDLSNVPELMQTFVPAQLLIGVKKSTSKGPEDENYNNPLGKCTNVI